MINPFFEEVLKIGKTAAPLNSLPFLTKIDDYSDVYLRNLKAPLEFDRVSEPGADSPNCFEIYWRLACKIPYHNDEHVIYNIVQMILISKCTIYLQIIAIY